MPPHKSFFWDRSGRRISRAPKVVEQPARTSGGGGTVGGVSTRRSAAQEVLTATLVLVATSSPEPVSGSLSFTHTSGAVLTSLADPTVPALLTSGDYTLEGFSSSDVPESEYLLALRCDYPAPIPEFGVSNLLALFGSLGPLGLGDFSGAPLVTVSGIFAGAATFEHVYVAFSEVDMTVTFTLVLIRHAS